MTTAPAKTADPAIRKTLRTGWLLLAIALPFGVTLEGLHGFKVQAYLASEMRREMWRLAHAHGTLLGILCLVSAAIAEAYIAAPIRPLGFFLGGVLNSEGDPSLGILLVPVGALLLVIALVRVALAPRPR
jgi:hypothetical protein